ncbi:unnamed protein product [Polarella glacialis]|uniref:Uncharacterized protein n=1 Tax=Polarella glacialis TaxID=89957 RepID=A0A813LRR8_POLGL|nr:unnamed protein product [Polarella glacialis]CAE8695375.1 unnamed protein product [Polarella glacialis]CAE8736820.1 unnamed protein product [Polarella glacialis]CAE8736822.1 unnamed protein product [Polarella glacialis]
MGRRYGVKAPALSAAEVAKYQEISAAVLAKGKSSDPQKNIARINSSLAAAAAMPSTPNDDYDIKDPEYVGIVLGGYGESTTTTGEIEVNIADVYVEEPRIVAGDDEEVDGDERSVWGDGDDEPNAEVEE